VNVTSDLGHVDAAIRAPQGAFLKDEGQPDMHRGICGLKREKCRIESGKTLVARTNRHHPSHPQFSVTPPNRRPRVLAVAIISSEEKISMGGDACKPAAI
jgi:hypothetical protein